MGSALESMLSGNFKYARRLVSAEELIDHGAGDDRAALEVAISQLKSRIESAAPDFIGPDLCETITVAFPLTKVSEKDFVARMIANPHVSCDLVTLARTAVSAE